jgi:hypothetical protein
MNTTNVEKKSLSPIWRFSRLQSRRWPVELTGRNSVTPSTIPRMIALMMSDNVECLRG